MTVTNPTSSGTNTNPSHSTSSSSSETPVSARAPPNTPMSNIIHTGTSSSSTSNSSSNSPLFTTAALRNQRGPPSASSSTWSPVPNQTILSSNVEEDEYETESEDIDEPIVVQKTTTVNAITVTGLPKPPSLADFSKTPLLIILHYFVFPFCQGAMYGLGEATARYYMRKWFGDMIAPSVAKSATVIKKGLMSTTNYSKASPALLASPYEREMEWRDVIDSIFGTGVASVSRDSSYIPDQQIDTHRSVGSLAIGAGNSWGHKVYIPN